jgi:hypothetical protein
VSNYGVSGYGTDQALVRFRRTSNDAAPTAILGIFPENLLRNVNQYRALFGFPQHPQWLKGRFTLDGADALRWIARPQIGLDGFVELHRDPSKIIPHEYFLPDTRDGPVTWRFPAMLTTFQLALRPRLMTRITGRPSWAAFYDPAHRSGALPLTVAIVEAFVRDAAARGQRALVVMLPGASSFRARTAFGAFEYAPLVAALSARNVDVFDIGAALMADGMRNYCELYLNPAACSGHLGIAGSAAFAEIVAAELRRRGLVK